MRYTLLIFIILSISQNLLAHPIKMSTGKINFDTNSNTCTLTINLFNDDFESELRKMYPQPPFNFSKPDEIMVSSIEEYIFKNIKLKIGGKYIELELKSITQPDDNVCQVILTGDIPSISNYITVINTILFSSFEKQTNMLHIFKNNQQVQILQFYPSDASKTIHI